MITRAVTIIVWPTGNLVVRNNHEGLWLWIWNPHQQSETQCMNKSQAEHNRTNWAQRHCDRKRSDFNLWQPFCFHRNDREVAPTLLERMMLSSVWTSSKPGAEDKTLGWKKKKRVSEETSCLGKALKDYFIWWKLKWITICFQ